MSFTNIIDRQAASALSPTEQARQVIKAASELSIATHLGRAARMSAKVQIQPVLALLPEAYWVTGGDAGLKQTSLAKCEGLDLVAEEIACIVAVPQSVFDDASFGVWSELRDPIAAAIGATLDAAVLMGVQRAASWPPSVLEGATAAGNVAQTGATAQQGGAYADLEAVLGLVEDDGFAPDNFVGAPRLRRKLRQARNAAGDWLGSTEGATTSDLEGRFTDAQEPLRVAFVSSMRTTGFDVPSCSTI